MASTQPVALQAKQAVHQFEKPGAVRLMYLDIFRGLLKRLFSKILGLDCGISCDVWKKVIFFMREALAQTANLSDNVQTFRSRTKE